MPVSSEAVRVFMPGSFDLVLCNLGMTGLTGWDVAERVRTSDPDVPVIFIKGLGAAGGRPGPPGCGRAFRGGAA